MDEGQPDYLSYLLRLWRVHEQGPLDGDQVKTSASDWRASLQRPGSGERLSFATLDELFAYLRRQTGTRAGTEHADPRKDLDREEDSAG
jgi:hypothetical protein